MWDPYAEFQSETLPNGLTVHAAHWPGRPWEAVGFLIHSGAEHDPVGLEGLSHFVEHLISENTTVSKKQICTRIEDWGGEVYLGGTSYSYTRYSFFVPAENAKLVQALSIFGGMLLSAKLERYIERERQVIVGEFHRAHPVRSGYELEMRQQKALYKGCWLERFTRPLGNPESIGRITQADLQKHYETHYTPANMSVVGVGGMELHQLTMLLTNTPFMLDKPGKRTELPIPVPLVAPPAENRYVFEVSQHMTMLTPLEVGQFKSVAKLPGTVNPWSVRLLAMMLDETLTEEVRERRAWAYHIAPERHNFRSFWEFSVNCVGLALRALDEIEEVVEVAIASLNDRDDLFEQAKRRTIAHNLMIDPTGQGIREGALDDLADCQRIISLAEFSAGFERTTMNDIRKLLHWLRPEQRWTLIVRP